MKRKGEPYPPVNASRHRRWRVWYDLGGSDEIETAWYARSPAGETIMAAEWNDLLGGVDNIEDVLQRDNGDRLATIAHNPPRPAGGWLFWSPDARLLSLKPGRPTFPPATANPETAQ